MGIFSNIRDARRQRKAMAKGEKIAQEISNRLMVDPLCSNYENLFAQVRPLIDEMKSVFPYGVSNSGRKLPLSRTPELAVLQDPNDDMGWQDFADAMFATWLSEDELDIHCWFNKRGELDGYTIIPPSAFVGKRDGKKYWSVTNANGSVVEVSEDDVMRIRFSRSPRNLDKGVSPASATKVIAQIDDLMAQYQKAFFENGAVPATITFITASSPDKFDEVKAELESKTKGAKNKNKTIYVWRQMLDTGETKDQVEVKVIQGNNSTLAIKELRDYIDDRLNKAVGVSNFLMGDDSSAKYDNAELSDHQFTRRRVYPALLSFWNQFQHELERVLGTGLGYGIDFDLEIPDLTERRKVKAEIAERTVESLTKLIKDGATPAAAMLALGLDDNWKPAANSIFASVVAGRSVDVSSRTSDVKEQETKTVFAETPRLVNKENIPPTRDAVPTTDAPAQDAVDVEEDLEGLDWDEDEEAEEAVYNELVELAESGAADLVEDITGERPTEAPSKTVEGVVSAIADIVAGVALNGVVEASNALKTQVDGEVKAGVEELGKNPKVSKTLTDRLKVRAGDLVRRYGDYTKTAFENAILNEKPQTAGDIVKTLRKVVPKGRAELIARNEVVHGERSGRLDADKAIADEYGLTISLVWRCHHDDATCAVCEAMDGEVTELGKAFPDSVEKDGVKLAWEYSEWNDNGEVPDAHVNCRCYYDEKVEVG